MSEENKFYGRKTTKKSAIKLLQESIRYIQHDINCLVVQREIGKCNCGRNKLVDTIKRILVGESNAKKRS